MDTLYLLDISDNVSLLLIITLTMFSSKDITSTLIEGQIIRDYFPSDLNYKIYSYTPQTNIKKDIKIVLTRINVKFDFYVFTSCDYIREEYRYMN